MHENPKHTDDTTTLTNVYWSKDKNLDNKIINNQVLKFHLKFLLSTFKSLIAEGMKKVFLGAHYKTGLRALHWYSLVMLADNSFVYRITFFHQRERERESTQVSLLNESVVCRNVQSQLYILASGLEAPLLTPEPPCPEVHVRSRIT